jgi:hypothetical protein
MLDMMVSVRNGLFKTLMMSGGEGETLVYLHTSLSTRASGTRRESSISTTSTT